MGASWIGKRGKKVQNTSCTGLLIPKDTAKVNHTRSARPQSPRIQTIKVSLTSNPGQSGMPDTGFTIDRWWHRKQSFEITGKMRVICETAPKPDFPHGHFCPVKQTTGFANPHQAQQIRKPAIGLLQTPLQSPTGTFQARLQRHQSSSCDRYPVQERYKVVARSGVAHRSPGPFPAYWP